MCLDPFRKASKNALAAFKNDVTFLEEARTLEKAGATCCFSLGLLHFALLGGSYDAFVLLVSRGFRLSKKKLRVAWVFPACTPRDMVARGAELLADECRAREKTEQEKGRAKLLAVLDAGFVLQLWPWEVRQCVWRACVC